MRKTVECEIVKKKKKQKLLNTAKQSTKNLANKSFDEHTNLNKLALLLKACHKRLHP